MESIKDLSFEAASGELETIVSQLESGTLNLDETVTLYQRGRQLAKHCQALLNTIELRIQKIGQDD